MRRFSLGVALLAGLMLAPVAPLAHAQYTGYGYSGYGPAGLSYTYSGAGLPYGSTPNGILSPTLPYSSIGSYSYGPYAGFSTATPSSGGGYGSYPYGAYGGGGYGLSPYGGYGAGYGQSPYGGYGAGVAGYGTYGAAGYGGYGAYGAGMSPYGYGSYGAGYGGGYGYPGYSAGYSSNGAYPGYGVGGAVGPYGY